MGNKTNKVSFNFFKSKTIQIPADKKNAFAAAKQEIFDIYRKINNAYKIYFLGAKLVNRQRYEIVKYRDLDGKIKRKRVLKTVDNNKIEFHGNWKFKLAGDKTSIGQAIHALYDFLTNLEKVKIEYPDKVKSEKPKKPEKPESQPIEKPEKNKKKQPFLRENI